MEAFDRRVEAFGHFLRSGFEGLASDPHGGKLIFSHGRRFPVCRPGRRFLQSRKRAIQSSLSFLDASHQVPSSLPILITFPQLPENRMSIAEPSTPDPHPLGVDKRIFQNVFIADKAWHTARRW